MSDDVTSIYRMRMVEFPSNKMATGGSDLTANSDEIYIQCCLCFQENRKREAEKYCIDCKDYFCLPCVSIHKKISFMRGHQILDKADFKSTGPDGSLPSYPTQRCSEHENEVLTMFCEDHDVVECPRCIALSHRSCKKIISIPEEIQDLYCNMKPGDVKLKLRQLSKTLEAIRTSKEAELKALDENLEKEIASVRAFRQELKELLDMAEKATINELRNKYDTICIAVSENIETIKCQVKCLSESIEQFQKCEGNMSQEFVSAKCSEKLAVGAKELETTFKRKPITSCKFIPYQDIMEFLGKSNNLGKVSLCNENTEVMSCMKDGLYTVKRKKVINVKLQNDINACSIWGSCITDDGFLLLADYSNSKLKRIDLKKENVSDYIGLQGSQSVCTVSGTEAAVTLCNKSVVFISLGEKMAVTRTLKMNHFCWGIACKDDKLYVSDNSTTLYVYDMNGRLIQNICKDNNGRDIFTNNQHIAVSVDGNKVYVANWQNGFVVLDNHGTYLTTLTDSRIPYFCGVCTDGSNVFVSGYNSKDIVQISPDPKTLGVVGNDTNVTSLSFDQRNSRLILTKESSDMIKILELNYSTKI